jgi:hypothetical protein
MVAGGGGSASALSSPTAIASEAKKIPQPVTNALMVTSLSSLAMGLATIEHP